MDRLEVDASTTLSQLRGMIAERLGIPVEQQVISLKAGGRERLASSSDRSSMKKLKLGHGDMLFIDYEIVRADKQGAPKVLGENDPLAKANRKKPTQELRAIKNQWTLDEFQRMRAEKEYEVSVLVVVLVVLVLTLVLTLVQVAVVLVLLLPLLPLLLPLLTVPPQLTLIGNPTSTQPEVHCAKASVDQAAVAAFNDYFQKTGNAQYRVGYVYGTFSDDGGVQVDAILEPPQVQIT